MRTIVVLIGTVAMAFAAIGLAVAAPGGDAAARFELSAASGAVHIANSRAGQAVFSATGARPGQTVGGTVTIGNDGDARGKFALAVTGVTENAGPHGGLLSERLRLVVVDVTDADDPDPVYEGDAADLGEVGLGKLDPGEERDYSVLATLPGTADNRYQGASLSLGLEWRAGKDAVSTPTPTPTPTPTTPTAPTTPTTPTTPTAPTTPTTPTSPVVVETLGLPAANTCVKSGKLTLKLKPPQGTKVVSATVVVNGKVKARLNGAKARKAVSLRGLRGSRSKVSISLKASDGRSYSASRTYRACAKRKS